MAANNRASLTTATLKYVKKNFEPAPTPPDRTVLEHWIYACCLENETHADADKAYQAITDAAFDWNEMRVTTITELAEQMSALANPREAATRVKRTLQGVFEWKYTYDLEPLKKQNLGKTEKDMKKLHGTTQFSVSYVVQHALGGHSIPLDQGLLDAMLIIGVIDEKERKNASVPGLERAISKKNGIAEGSLLHQLGAIVYKSPYSPATKDALLAINPDAKSRLPKRQRKTKPAPEPNAEKTKPSKKTADKNTKDSKKTTAATKKKATATKKSTAPKSATKKKATAAKKKTSSVAKKKATKKKATIAKKKVTKKKATKKKATKKKATTKKKKRSTSKQLTKRKPR